MVWLCPFLSMKLKILQLAPLYEALTLNLGYGSIERIVMSLDRCFTKLGVLLCRSFARK